MEWQIVEKKNPLAIHGIFDCQNRAEWFLETIVPRYVARGYYSDKTLTKHDFKIVKRGRVF